MTGEQAADGRLVTPTFVVVTVSALAYFVAIGSLAPVLPLYVEDDLAGGGVAIGVVLGAFAVSAALLRPLAGRLGDRRGRRVLVVGGASVFAVSALGYGLVASVPWLVAMRLLSGVGEAGVFVGAATTAQDLAPRERRGEAASYFSVAVYGGLGAGPPLGEAVLHAHGPGAVWILAASLAGVAALLGLGVPGPGPTSAASATEVPGAARKRILHPAAVGPGVVLLLATTGLAAFIGFMPLYAQDLGLSGSGQVFLLYSVLVLLVRLVGARIPDEVGPRRAATAALALQSAGFFVMGVWATTTGLYSSTVVYALGVSLMYPSLLPLVIDAAPDAERGQAVGTFTLFFDVAQGVGGFLFGVVAALGGNRATFPVAGLLALAGLVVFRAGVGRAPARELDPPVNAPGD